LDTFRLRLERERICPFPATTDIPREAELSWHEGLCPEIAAGVDRYDLCVVRHGSFASEWPVTVHIPDAIAGVRHSLGLSQAKFASALDTTRLNIERWESGKARPFRGKVLPLVTMVRPLVDSPTTAGQVFNLLAAAVLPKITRPAGTYSRIQIQQMLLDPSGDHRDLADKLLELLIDSEILIPVDFDDYSENAEFVPRVGIRALDRQQQPWAIDLIASVSHLSEKDRTLVTSLASRLARSA
jgi:transcriptional regulator with XRE-family HTH domain